MSRTLEDILESAEYWSNKNGFEQEAFRELLTIIKILVNERQKVKDKHIIEEVACYQIEIAVPEGTHSYIYSDNIPSDLTIKEKYGLFARVGSISPLMHVIQHKQILEELNK